MRRPLPAHGTNARYQRGCNKGTGAAEQPHPIVRCPTCGSPAYSRSTGLDAAGTDRKCG